MHNVVRSFDRNANEQVNHLVTPILEGRIVVIHLIRCRDFARAFSFRVFPQFWQAWSKQLIEAADAQQVESARTAAIELQRLVSSLQGVAEQEFFQYISTTFVKFKNKMLTPLPADERFLANFLSLNLPLDAEEMILLTAMTHQAEANCADSLWALQQRLALLNEGKKLDERTNPSSPLQFCDAIHKVLCGLGLSSDVKMKAYKLFEVHVLNQLESLYVETNAYLAYQELLPHLSVSSSSKASASQSAYVAHALPIAEVIEPLPVAEVELIELDTHFIDGSGKAYFDLLQSLQAKALSSVEAAFKPGVVAALDIHPLSRAFTEIDAQCELHDNEIAAVKQVTRLFRYVETDESLQDSIKALVSYLYIPYVKSALLDNHFLSHDEHPGCVLLNALAEAGVRWIDKEGRDPFDIASKIKTAVLRVLKEFDRDTVVMKEAWVDFNAYVHNISRRQDVIEQRVLEKAQGEEKLRGAKWQVNALVSARTRHRDIPSPILLLLLQPWSDYLSFVLLRYGEDSDSWHKAVDVMDELLWSLEPMLTLSDKSRQTKGQADLLAVLEQGFDTIGYEKTKARKLLDAVITLQRFAYQGKKADAAPAFLRLKLEAMAAEKAGYTGIGLEEPQTAQEQEYVNYVAVIEQGSVFETVNGKRFKLIHFNETTQHYLLLNQQTARVTLMTRLQLARDIIAGKVRLLADSAKPFLVRAMTSIAVMAANKPIQFAND